MNNKINIKALSKEELILLVQELSMINGCGKIIISPRIIARAPDVCAYLEYVNGCLELTNNEISKIV